MSRSPIGPGEDVEAWCTRCKMNLNHRVIAVVGSEVRRVHCLTCGGDHNYYPPKHQKAPKREKTPTSKSRAESAAPAATKAVSAARALSEWTTIMKKMPPEVVPRPYRATEVFATGEFIDHVRFGVGKVLAMAARDKMEVIFQSGRKVLICGK
ncbi:MAG: hypothetical protein AB1646_16520 [Thermodesulfobacteriota bacterium]